jgi:hypothetical protein
MGGLNSSLQIFFGFRVLDTAIQSIGFSGAFSVQAFGTNALSQLIFVIPEKVPTWNEVLYGDRIHAPVTRSVTHRTLRKKDSRLDNSGAIDSPSFRILSTATSPGVYTLTTKNFPSPENMIFQYFDSVVTPVIL